MPRSMAVGDIAIGWVVAAAMNSSTRLRVSSSRLIFTTTSNGAAASCWACSACADPSPISISPTTIHMG